MGDIVGAGLKRRAGRFRAGWEEHARNALMMLCIGVLAWLGIETTDFGGDWLP